MLGGAPGHAPAQRNRLRSPGQPSAHAPNHADLIRGDLLAVPSPGPQPAKAVKPKKPKIPRSRPIYHPNGPPEYICSQCGARFTWGAESTWFGTLLEMDDGRPLVFGCTAACVEKLAAALGHPPEHAIDLED